MTILKKIGIDRDDAAHADFNRLKPDLLARCLWIKNLLVMMSMNYEFRPRAWASSSIAA
jgi:hypothetical protein